MRRACALLLLGLTLAACGKYGPPVRNRPVAAAPTAAQPTAAQPAAAEPEAADYEERESSQ